MELKKRMAYTIRRSARAIGITSSTTCVAFFANYFSSVMPIRVFGVFAGTLVLLNYAMVTLIFPAFIIVHEYWI